MATVRILRSTTTGNTPGSLVTGQLAINEADGTLYYRNLSGVSTPLPAYVPDGYAYDCGVYGPIAPAAPTGISGTPGVGAVSLSWSAPANTGGVSLTDYIVQYSVDLTNWTTVSDGTSTTASAVVNGLTGGVSHYFRVAAVNSVGTGPYVTSSAVIPSSSKLTCTRRIGSPSTFSGDGTSASPFTRAARVSNTNSDGLASAANGSTTGMSTGAYAFTAVASGTAYVTVTFYDDDLNSNAANILKNGVSQGGSLSDGQTVTARSIAVSAGDVITFYANSSLTSFSNVSVWAV